MVDGSWSAKGMLWASVWIRVSLGSQQVGRRSGREWTGLRCWRLLGGTGVLGNLRRQAPPLGACVSGGCPTRDSRSPSPRSPEALPPWPYSTDAATAPRRPDGAWATAGRGSAPEHQPRQSACGTAVHSESGDEGARTNASSSLSRSRSASAATLSPTRRLAQGEHRARSARTTGLST
jgi:hypothetical protein